IDLHVVSVLPGSFITRIRPMKPLVEAAVQIVDEQIMNAGRKPIVAKPFHHAIVAEGEKAPWQGAMCARGPHKATAWIRFIRSSIAGLYSKWLCGTVCSRAPLQKAYIKTIAVDQLGVLARIYAPERHQPSQIAAGNGNVGGDIVQNHSRGKTHFVVVGI